MNMWNAGTPSFECVVGPNGLRCSVVVNGIPTSVP